MKRNLVLLIILTIAAALIGGLGYAAYCVHQVITVVVPNAYATDWASEFVVEHLKSSENRWPTGWNDLRDEYDRLNKPGSYPWSWVEFQQRVIIDWDADPTVLARADASKSPPFTVIRLSDGSQSHWEGSEPNRKIFEYLQSARLIHESP